MVRLSLLSAVVAALSVASVYAAPPNTSIPVASNKPSSGDGSPYRVLQGKYSNRGWIVSSRMTAKDDLVVHLPPGWAGFTHVNREYWLQSDDSMKTCSASGTGEDSSCSNSVSFWSYTANDHLNGYWDIRN
ncbi:hypothetical protein GQ42DRAFT_180287 [Ramicandelaber brevisporus]|nr:hypothetical protein GQ42DRAFT_180287 [Ramicandelaber brevisporus]